ncbi:winged helix DNA-binding domain-containing protein [Smaragdicoccus niigatensis]|uniref:winged helix DNA-binding domain-containing protein n=1 Tax=Smaragdicoccus niigatensis TaxID=359359 RepID=UPI00035E56E7|nr:winged helix DNA-binding domain-containing protein [Smaragdicoccus niigatensis]
MVDLTTDQALALRVRNLLLAPDSLTCESGAQVVSWFGAMQAQEIGSGLWSLGARLPGRSIDEIRQEQEDRSIVRTWPMRGTVHWVPSADAKWMLELTGVKVLAGAEYRRKYHGLEEATVNQAVDVLGNALKERTRLTRAQCLESIEKAGISTGGQMGYHFLWYASQVGVTAIAPNVGTEQTFVLLDEWAPSPNQPDDPAATLAWRYFQSHGPTTRKDFAGWTGLNLTEAKQAIAGAELTAVAVDGIEMFCTEESLESVPDRPVDEMRVLPGFDEFLLGFKDRSMMLDDVHKHAIIPGGNGVFQPTIVRAGRVVGTWKRKSALKTKTVLTVTPLVRLNKRQRAAITKAFEPYSTYLGQPVELVWPD